MSGLPIMLANTATRTGAPPGDLPAGTLSGIAIFRALAPDVVEALSRRCRWRRYRAGQTILQRQDESREVFLLVRGRVSVVYHSPSGREIRLGDLAAGEIFGELAAIDGEPRCADIVCATDALVASLSADLFWDLLQQHPSVCAAVLRRLVQMARTHLQRLLELSTLPARSRLHAELLRLAQIGVSGSDRPVGVIAPAPTHAEIASRISTHREAVTRELNGLVRAKLIEKGGSTLVIRDLAALTSMVEETLGERQPNGSRREPGRAPDQPRGRRAVLADETLRL
jgi:CRP-like cAMP-binding protein